MKLPVNLNKANQLVESHQYRDAEIVLKEITIQNLTIQQHRIYNILMLMVMTYRSDVDTLYKFSKSILPYHQEDVIKFHHLMVRLQYNLFHQPRSRADVIFDLVEEKVALTHNSTYLLIFYLQKAKYQNDANDYYGALLTLSAFGAYEVPCPLMYFEEKIRALIGLNLSKSVTETRDEIENFVSDKNLKTEKRETLSAIYLRVAIFENDQMATKKYTAELNEILLGLQTPLSSDHLILIKGFKALGYNKANLDLIVNSFEINDQSVPYLKKLEEIYQNNNSALIYDSAKDVAEIFLT